MLDADICATSALPLLFFQKHQSKLKNKPN